MIVDSHCHLNFDDFGDDIEDIVQRAKENSVSAILNAGSVVDELETQLELCEKYPFVYTAVGIHPHNAKDYAKQNFQRFISVQFYQRFDVFHRLCMGRDEQFAFQFFHLFSQDIFIDFLFKRKIY